MSETSFSAAIEIRSETLCRVLMANLELLQTEEAEIYLDTDEFTVDMVDWGYIRFKTPENINQIVDCLCELFVELFKEAIGVNGNRIKQIDDLIDQIKKKHREIEDDINYINWNFEALMGVSDIRDRYDDASLFTIKAFVLNESVDGIVTIYDETEDQETEQRIDDLSETELRECFEDLCYDRGWVKEKLVYNNHVINYKCSFKSLR